MEIQRQLPDQILYLEFSQSWGIKSLASNFPNVPLLIPIVQRCRTVYFSPADAEFPRHRTRYVQRVGASSSTLRIPPHALPACRTALEKEETALIYPFCALDIRTGVSVCSLAAPVVVLYTAGNSGCFRRWAGEFTLKL